MEFIISVLFWASFGVAGAIVASEAYDKIPAFREFIKRIF